MKMSVVIPCYNEAENIPLIFERFSEVVGNRNIEIILVNNGSTDNSAEVLDGLLPKYNFAKTVFVPINQGYGYGILQGLAEADGEYIGWTHADMQTDPADLIKAYKLLEKHKGEKVYVKGTRIGRPIFDEIFTKGMSLFETMLLGVQLSDINAQPNIFPREFYEEWDNPPHDFSLDLFALYMAKCRNIKLIRFAVKFPERIHGESKWNTGLMSKWKFIKRTIGFSIKLKKKLKRG